MPKSAARPLRSKALIGMVHVGALPGTPSSEDTVPMLAMRAVAEAKLLVDCGFDGLILENMHDRPYVHGRQGPEVVAAMTRADGVLSTAATELAAGGNGDRTGAQLALEILQGAERRLAARSSTGCPYGLEPLFPPVEGGPPAQPRQAIRYAEQFLAAEPLLEHAHVRLMQLYYAVGDRGRVTQ